jgi:hypothetical protein
MSTISRTARVLSPLYTSTPLNLTRRQSSRVDDHTRPVRHSDTSRSSSQLTSIPRGRRHSVSGYGDGFGTARPDSPRPQQLRRSDSPEYPRHQENPSPRRESSIVSGQSSSRARETILQGIEPVRNSQGQRRVGIQETHPSQFGG